MDLDEAERWARGYAAKPEKERHREVGALLAEIARLRAAVEAVRELHRPEDVTIRNSWTIRMCSHCAETGDPFCVVSDDWPCPTVQALAAAEENARG
jgi:hypothetical protein